MSKPVFTLVQAQYFVRVAELGSMTEAATEMFVAQSAISAAVAQLESNLGCQLLTRHRTKGVTLTEQGRAFHQAARRVLTAADAAVNATRSEGLTGTLTAGCFTTLAPFWLPDIYERLERSHPELSVQIRETTADEISGLLARRDLETVLTYGFDYGKTVDFTPISEAPVYACVHEDHPLATRHSVTLQELATEPLILLDLGKSSSYFVSLFQSARLTPHILARFENYEVVRSMVGRGHGYCLVNQQPKHHLTNDGHRLVTMPVVDAPALLRVGVAHRAGEPLSERGAAFARECERAFAKAPPPRPQM